MGERSAGILLWRRVPHVEVLIAHMGGPLWARKEAAAWTLPKGLVEPGEDELAAALREFREELGIPAPEAAYAPLVEARYRSGKVVAVFAAEADLDLSGLDPGEFTMEWPPRSGRRVAFPEVDRARWTPLDEARALLVAGQRAALDALAAIS
jgi:predicted NUDIX family NTP pyrophosphohydrolase